MKNAANLGANLTAFVVTFAISFFLSPFIVRTLGVEANGLIGLTTNFLNYASVLTIVMSSMVARFVTIELRSGRPQAANEYYTAAYAGDLLGAAVLLPIMTVTVANFGEWFNVPDFLVHDAQLLASLYFASFLLTLVLPRWLVGTWATNNLYLDSIRNMQSVLIRAGLIVLLFVLLDPAVYFVGLAVLAAGVFSLGFSGYYKHRFLPGLRVHVRDLRWGRMRELWLGGFWNTVNYLGTVLSTGLHLLLASVFLGATRMGLLALAMTVPAMVNQLAQSLTTVFLPNLAFAFAEKDHAAMRAQLRRAMSVAAMLTTMPLAILVVFGETFFGLWIPGEDASALNGLSLAVAAGIAMPVISQPLQNVFVITNSQKEHSSASMVLGFVNVALAVVLLTATGLGVYAILVAAALTTSFRALAFTVPMAGRRVHYGPWTFFPEVLRGAGYFGVLTLVGFVVRALHAPASWFALVLAVGVVCALGSLVNLLFLTAKADRQMVFTVAGRFLPWRR